MSIASIEKVKGYKKYTAATDYHTAWVSIVDQLRANPGVEMIVARFDNVPTNHPHYSGPHSMRSRINKGKDKAFRDGTFEARIATTPAFRYVVVKFVGE